MNAILTYLPFLSCFHVFHKVTMVSDAKVDATFSAEDSLG